MKLKTLKLIKKLKRGGATLATPLNYASFEVDEPLATGVIDIIDREFVTSAKKIANFNEFSEIKKIRKKIR